MLAHQKQDKFLIFSSSPLTLGHVGDGLDVLSIPYLAFTCLAPKKVREQMPTTFETLNRCRVILMELKFGARGLNLTAASRVIFCEPVLHRDVELQAIKVPIVCYIQINRLIDLFQRVHRIGQTKQITGKNTPSMQ